MFDLPTLTAHQRRDASHHRNHLKHTGFDMVQLSVYAKYIVNAGYLPTLYKKIEEVIPDDRKVRALSISDVEWSKTMLFQGKKRVQVELATQQLLIF